MSYNRYYSESSRLYNYLREEFLTADKQTLYNIISYYYKKYGSNAGDYLIKTYNSWKSGYTKVSSQTFGRIIEFMPKFLSDEKRFHILKEEIHIYFDNKRKDHKKKIRSIEDITDKFLEIQKEILEFGKEDLHWFIGQNIFTPEQIEHYLKICRYVLNEKIIQSYSQVVSDLIFIQGKFKHFNGVITSAEYKINFFDQSINIADIKKIGYTFNSLQEVNFKLDESFKKFGERYFLDELMKLSFIEKSNQVNNILKGNDIDTFFSHYLELSKQNTNHISMKSTYYGEGGSLYLNLEFIPIHTMYYSIVKLLSVVCIGALVVIIIVIFSKYWLILTFISLTFWINYFFPEIIKEFKNIKKANKYGQQ